MTTTVLIADDDRDYRSALGAVVGRVAELDLVGAADDADAAIELARVWRPDVAIVDVRMPGGGGPRVAEELRRAAPRTRILALSAYGDDATVVQMLEAGAVGYVLKGISAAELVNAIERIATGQEVVSADLPREPPQNGPRPVPAARIRVVIADDNAEFRDALAAILERADDFELVGKARDTNGAIRLAALYEPDLTLIDWSMPGGGGAVAVAEIGRGCPSTRVVALSASEDRDVVLRMLRAGASSYVVKSVTASDLLDALRATAAGKTALSPEVATPVVEELVVQLEAAEVRQRPARDRVARIRSLIDSSALRMVFQPIVSMKGLGVVGVEALARFDCEPRQSPDVWFGDATDAGLGTELDIAAARMALAILPELPLGVDLYINVPPDTIISSDFGEIVAAGRGGRVVVELTEHAPVGDYSSLARAIDGLRAEGFRVAVDDVGAGYASFRHLLNLHPDMLKIDVSLCRSIETDRVRRLLAGALVSLGRELGATVVAEGVETGAELGSLRELGVDSAQGFLLGRPASSPLDKLLAAAEINGAAA